MQAICQIRVAMGASQKESNERIVGEVDPVQEDWRIGQSGCIIIYPGAINSGVEYCIIFCFRVAYHSKMQHRF